MAGPGAADRLRLGTAVRVALVDLPNRLMDQEGVVIEVVEPGAAVRSMDVGSAPPPRFIRRRFVVQCQSTRVLRSASRLLVVAP